MIFFLSQFLLNRQEAGKRKLLLALPENTEDAKERKIVIEKKTKEKRQERSEKT
jgi:hypothetical protein